MLKSTWIVLLLVVAIELGVRLTTLNAQMNTISISYGVEGESAIYTYQIVQHSDAHMTCELFVQSRTVEREKFEWRSDVHVLSRDLMADFGVVSAKTEAVVPMSKERRKRIAIVCGGDGLETTATITGSDELLVSFIAKSVIIRELFGKVSLGKPKMYRLWETPNEMGSFLTPLSREEKEAARKTKGGR